MERIDIANWVVKMRNNDNCLGRKIFFLVVCLAILALTVPPALLLAEENIRGLAPTSDATYIPVLGGLLNKTHRNMYGQKKDLAECLVLRGSYIKDGKAYVAPGGLFYASSTSYHARPLMRDPFLLLGEHVFLVRLTPEKVVKENIKVEKGGKVLVDPSGYRIWFDFSTDHYEKPYGEFAFVAPSGFWPEEWSVSTSFPRAETAKKLNLPEGVIPQERDFIMDRAYLYGATKMVVGKVGFDEAVFSRVEYPRIKDAIFSMDRPYTISMLQESFRFYGTKRIYALRKETGVLVEVRNWTGTKVLASKLLIPSSQQEYHVADQDKMSLTRLDLDLHIELIVEPSWMKYSDYAPWANDVPYGWEEGHVTLAVYDDLVKVEDGKPWPNDDRWIVRLEPNLKTGMLERLILENRDPFVLSDENQSYDGPTKISEVWDRKYFNVVARDFEPEVVHDSYVRDSFYRRTDNLILWEDGRENIDFFIGLSPLFAPVMEDTFLQRLADPSYGVPVVKSRFTSYPQVVPNAKWFAPDPTAAFVPKMKGFVRKYVRNRKNYRLTASEALVIRRSYVDYRKKKIIIPPGGLYYSTRDSRNIRPGEPLYMVGKKAYLVGFKSYLVVRRDFRVDFWKEYPMGDENLLFWQDVPLGDGSKALRYLGTSLLWGRPMAELRITKYSGNNWGANIMLAQTLPGYGDLDKLNLAAGIYPSTDEPFVPDVFASGATYVIPKFVGPDFVEIKEMGTPGMNQFTITYKKPKRKVLAAGEEIKIGKYRLRLEGIDKGKKTLKLALRDATGKVVAEKTLGPLDQEVYDTLPQYAPSQDKISMAFEDMQVDLDVPIDFASGKVPMYIATETKTYYMDKPWPDDPRFMVRPDVCGHCYQLNEVILDNKDPIILDEDNPVFEGLGGYFKIVIDDFDGESINAWHIEDRLGRKTPNLAEYARNNVDVLVGVNGTVESFLRKTVLERLAYREIWRLK